jgi:two-component system response regulator NreC
MKIVVIEDHTMMRDLLLKACREAVPGGVASGARDASTGLVLCRREQPDLVILDLALPDRDGLDLLNELLAACPHARVIGISGYSDEFTLYRALHSKLHGFVDKNEQSFDSLIDAIKAVMKGQRYLSTTAQEARLALRNDPQAFDKILSDREQSLLGFFGGGLTNEEVADQLGLSVLTVRNHRCNIMAKLGLRSSPELIRYALEKGFTRPGSTLRLKTPRPKPV